LTSTPAGTRCGPPFCRPACHVRWPDAVLPSLKPIELTGEKDECGNVTIGAIDGKKSGGFYDAVCAALGSERKFDKGGWLGYGVAGPGKSFMDCHTAVCPPFDGKQALAGNGIMIAYAGKSPDAVKAAHAVGLKNGGADEGAWLPSAGSAERLLRRLSA